MSFTLQIYAEPVTRDKGSEVLVGYSVVSANPGIIFHVQE